MSRIAIPALRSVCWSAGVALFLFGLAANDSSAQDDYERPPIDYLNAEVHDPCAVLAKRIESGEVNLEYDETFGYLKSVLRELDIPASSQTLVFSKTSLQLHRISPRVPRSLYFNDDVYVGYCQRGDVLEFASTDPRQGATFYTMSQEKDEPPKFVRDRGGCLSCHSSSRTQNVPGYLVRSVFADGAGRPKLGSGSFTTDQTSEFKDRWGGWYVTGLHGSMRHMGNTIGTGDEMTFDRDLGANETDLSDRFRLDNYLTPHSDIVALMVLEHQTQMHNAITSANFETRRALHQSNQMNELLGRPQDHVSDSATRRIESSANRVLEQMLMCDEFQLTDEVSGTSSFAADFQARGPFDPRGRSLRDLDLVTRLFKYPCSYLIYSASFDALPDEVRKLVLKKLHAILEGQDDSPEYDHLTEEMRRDLMEILTETKPEFRKTVASI